MRQLRQRWDRREAVDLRQDSDVPTTTSLLKLFFRELPVPLVPEAHCRQLLTGLAGTERTGGKVKGQGLEEKGFRHIERGEGRHGDGDKLKARVGGVFYTIVASFLI